MVSLIERYGIMNIKIRNGDEYVGVFLKLDFDINNGIYRFNLGDIDV